MWSIMFTELNSYLNVWKYHLYRNVKHIFALSSFLSFGIKELLLFTTLAEVKGKYAEGDNFKIYGFCNA